MNVTHLGWGCAKAPEGAIEIGRITEAGLIGNGADGPADETRAGEHAMCTHQALTEHELRDGDALRLQQHMNVARHDALAERDCGHREVWSVEMFQNGSASIISSIDSICR